MAEVKHVLVIFTESVPGQEDEFNRWYNDLHIPDLLKIDGIEAVRRFEIAEMDPPQAATHRFLGIYELSRDPREVIDALVATRETRAPNSPAYDAAKSVRFYYTAITDRLTPGDVS
ncbi:MAG TPA: hypothetical protein VHC18_12430 [Amycolatopsis sp.]|nr:hypothetical protein [Amycolatopsis sp.]